MNCDALLPDRSPDELAHLTAAVDQRERGCRFHTGGAFFRASSRLSRDLAVLAGLVERDRLGSLRVLDAMAGCGVRALRAGCEAGATEIWANEANPEVLPTLRSNLEPLRAAPWRLSLKVTATDANRVLFDCYNRGDYFDLVDVDCFGAPAPFLSTALWAVKLGGLLYLASTDGRSATGHLPEQSLRIYGARARSHPAAHEQGLRLMLGALQQQAATKGLGIQPIFSLFRGEVYRVMVRLVSGQQLTDKNYAYLGYCHACGNYEVLPWSRLGRAFCQYHRSPFQVNNCGLNVETRSSDFPLTLSGPMWVGNLHDSNFLAAMQSQAIAKNWQDVSQWLEIAIAEANLPPYFFKLGEIGKRGRCDLPKRDWLIAQLKAQGFCASASHVDREAVKTNASLEECIHCAQAKLRSKKL